MKFYAKIGRIVVYGGLLYFGAYLGYKTNEMEWFRAMNKFCNERPDMTMKKFYEEIVEDKEDDDD